MRRPSLTWLATALGLSAAACGDATLEAHTLCYTVSDVAVPGASGSGTIATDLGYDLGSAVPELTRPGTSYSLTLQDVELSPGKGSSASDLAGLQALDVSARPPAGSSLPEAQVIHWVEKPGAHPARIQAAAQSQPDLAPYLAGGVLRLHVQATGTLPPDPWTVDATACFVLEVSVRYGL